MGLDRIQAGDALSARDLRDNARLTQRALAALGGAESVSNVGGTARIPLAYDFFIAKITGDETTPTRYNFTEQWYDADAEDWVDRPGGRTDGSGVVFAYPLDGAEYAIDDHVLCCLNKLDASKYDILMPVGGEAPTGTITVTTVDGSPSYTGITTLRLDEADGFVLTNPSAGIARIDIAAATDTQAGILSTATQNIGGLKNFAAGARGAFDGTFCNQGGGLSSDSGVAYGYSGYGYGYGIYWPPNIGNNSIDRCIWSLTEVSALWETQQFIELDSGSGESLITACFLPAGGGVSFPEVSFAISRDATWAIALRANSYYAYSGSTGWEGGIDLGPVDGTAALRFVQGILVDTDLTTGGVIYGGTTGLKSTPAGTAGQVLTTSSGVPVWADPTGITSIDGSTPTSLTGVICGDGATTFGRTLTAPAAGITVANGTGASGNPTLALADDLAGLEAMAGTGLVARTAANTYAQRTLTAPAAGITVANGGGVAGDPTLSLANDLAALEGLAGTGIAVRTGTDTWAQRTITSADASITITNPGGVAGNIDLSVQAVPVGTVQMHAGRTVPSGWLECDGSAVSRTTYATLFAACALSRSGSTNSGNANITGLSTTADMYLGMRVTGTGIPAGSYIFSILSGTSVQLNQTATATGTPTLTFSTFGGGNGSTTFNVPDLRGNVPVGPPASLVLGSYYAGIGATGGAATHTLATSEIPAHTHTYNDGNLTADRGLGANFSSTSESSVASGSAGGGGAHNNVQPFQVIRFIIKT